MLPLCFQLNTSPGASTHRVWNKRDDMQDTVNLPAVLKHKEKMRDGLCCESGDTGVLSVMNRVAGMPLVPNPRQ